MKSVRKRYFCLLEGSLIYYEDDTRKVCRGEVALSQATKVIAMEHNKRKQLQGLCGFAVTHGLQNREKIILATEDGEAGRRSWIEQIRLAADPARAPAKPGIAEGKAASTDTTDAGQSPPRVRSPSRPGGAEDVSSPSSSSSAHDRSSTPGTPRGAESDGGASIDQVPTPETSLGRELSGGSFEEEVSAEEPDPAAGPAQREELPTRPAGEATGSSTPDSGGGFPVTRARSSGLPPGLESSLKFRGVA